VAILEIVPESLAIARARLRLNGKERQSETSISRMNAHFHVRVYQLENRSNSTGLSEASDNDMHNALLIFDSLKSGCRIWDDSTLASHEPSFEIVRLLCKRVQSSTYP
jgi:hypothetical protein